MFHCCSSLSKAIINDDIGSVRKFIAKGWNLNNKDNMGWTPLHMAVKKQRANIVNLLLKQPNPPINEQDVEGNTCLILACEHEEYNIDIIDSILRNKADTDIPNNMGTTAIHLLAKKSHEPVLRLLLKYTPNMNCQDYNEYTPLHHAVANDCTDAVVELLLRSGADANICELNGLNPLMFSLMCNIELAQLFIPYTLSLDTKANDGWTALMFAVNKQNLGIINELVNRGADVHAEAEGHSVLSLAIGSQDNGIFKLIWDKVNADMVSRNSHLLQSVRRYWTIHIHIDNFETLFSRDDINFNLSEIDIDFGNRTLISADDEDDLNLYMLAVLLEPCYENINFNDLKNYYFYIIRSMLSRSKYITNLDMKVFLKYFRNCPYIIELLDMVMQQMLMPNISPDIVLYAMHDSVNTPVYLLQYCIHLDKNVVFDMLLQTLPVSAVLLQAFANIFTISSYWKQRFNVAFDANNLTNISHKLIREKLVNSKLEVESLRELSRDSVRRHLGQICSTTKQFLNIVNELPVPLHVKHIIQCKITPHHCK